MDQSIKQRWQTLDNRRKTILTRAKEFAELVMPTLYPRDGLCETSELPVPFSAAAGRGCSRLASRLTSALVPLNNLPFFSLQIDDEEPIEGEDPTPEQDALHRLERRMMRKLSATNFRSVVYTCLQHLQVTGNCLMMANDNYNYSIFRIDQFVIVRRPDGDWYEIITKQQVDPASLPKILKDAGFADDPTFVRTNFNYDQDDAIFTHILNDENGGCTIKREYKGRVFDTGSYPVCPYFPLRWNLVAGENYGRGLVEDNIGDIRALEVMAESLLDSIAANAEYRFGVNPAGLTEIHDLQESTNGAFVPAAPNDVFPIQLGNQAMVAAAQASVTLKEQTLGHVFLLNSSIQRQGERVTATEIRVLANELEQALGGVFSDSARELLIPVLRYLMYRMLLDGSLLPKDDPAAEAMVEELKKPDGILKLRIRTGLESLNREIERETIGEIIAEARQFPEAGQQAVIWPGLVSRWIQSKGIEPKGLVKSTQDLQQEQQAAAQAQQQQAMQEQVMSTTGRIAEQAAGQAGVSNV